MMMYPFSSTYINYTQVEQFKELTMLEKCLNVQFKDVIAFQLLNNDYVISDNASAYFCLDAQKSDKKVIVHNS